MFHIPREPESGISRLASTTGIVYSERMAVDPALLEILVCPACKKPVHLTASGNGLKCDACRRVFPVKDDIPVMLIDEATIDA